MTSSLIDKPRASLSVVPDASSGVVSEARTRAPLWAFPTEGDDLKRARDYCGQARLTMDRILSAKRDHKGAQGRDRHWISEQLADLQRGAKRLRALAIYRSTQDVLNVVQGRHTHTPINWAIVDGRLVVLNKLIAQYTDGLNSIWDAYDHGAPDDNNDADCEDSDNETDSAVSDDLALQDLTGLDLTAITELETAQTAEPKTAQPVLTRYGKASLTPRPVHQTETVSANTATAQPEPRDTLQSLLPHARPEERAALQRLINLTRATSAETAEAQDDNQKTAKAGPSKIETLLQEDNDTVQLVEALPQLVQQLLGEGREYGKTLSVSYALDHVILSEDERSSLLQRLHVRLSDLIAGSMPLQGIGHLDLVADDNDLRISGTGFEPFMIDIIVNAISSDEHTKQKTPQPPLPRITDATEDDLRAQLAALMDGGMDLAVSEAPDSETSDAETAPRNHG